MVDSEYTDSEYDSDIDNEYEENHLIYEPEEMSQTRYNIILCELYNERIHGNTNCEVLYHYLVNTRYKHLNLYYLNEHSNEIQNEYTYLHNQSHDIYRNYRNIINNNYIKPQIGECIYLNTGHCVVILKTFWIKIIQRSWKNILKNRQTIIKKRCHPNSLRHREITGKWPNECLNYPGLRGMLSRNG
jgi:hypothetical protein